MNFYEKKLKGSAVYNGKILTLDVDDVELPDKKISKREVVRHCGGAAVLLVRDMEALLVKQFRYAYGKEIYEIPAGKLNAGEEPAHAAARELEEETGFKAELVRLAEIYPSPGYTDEVIHIFLAENARRAEQKLDEGEFLTAEFIPLSKVLGMLERGEITDAKTAVAVYKYMYMNGISVNG